MTQLEQKIFEKQTCSMSRDQKQIALIKLRHRFCIEFATGGALRWHHDIVVTGDSRERSAVRRLRQDKVALGIGETVSCAHLLAPDRMRHRSKLRFHRFRQLARSPKGTCRLTDVLCTQQEGRAD